MRVFELWKPGGWLEGIDDERQLRDADTLLSLLAECLADAAVALALFEEAQAKEFNEPGFDEERWERDRQQDSRVRERMEAELMSRLRTDLGQEQAYIAYSEAYGEMLALATAEAKRLRWQAGDVPKYYQSRLPNMHAKSCLYALDTMQKSLESLVALPAAPAQIAAALAEFKAAFPRLVAVRNSAHHAEDRVLGKKQRGARIEMVPVMNDTVHAPDGCLITDALSGNRFGTTVEDGSFAEVEISVQSVAAAQKIVQSVYDAFQWRGFKSHEPS